MLALTLVITEVMKNKTVASDVSVTQSVLEEREEESVPANE